MRLSYYFLTIVLDSSRITYMGDSCVYDDTYLFSECSVDEDAAHFRTGDTGMEILLMVPRSGASSC